MVADGAVALLFGRLRSQALKSILAGKWKLEVPNVLHRAGADCMQLDSADLWSYGAKADTLIMTLTAQPQLSTP